VIAPGWPTRCSLRTRTVGALPLDPAGFRRSPGSAIASLARREVDREGQGFSISGRGAGSAGGGGRYRGMGGVRRPEPGELPAEGAVPGELRIGQCRRRIYTGTEDTEGRLVEEKERCLVSDHVSHGRRGDSSAVSYARGWVRPREMGGQVHLVWNSKRVTGGSADSASQTRISRHRSRRRERNDLLNSRMPKTRFESGSAATDYLVVALRSRGPAFRLQSRSLHLLPRGRA